jgi:uncharacterized protein (TIGR04255 family)
VSPVQDVAPEREIGGRTLVIRIPKKLKDDPIVEALFEVRFTSKEVVPEVVLGKLASREEWKAYKTVRLPIADFPAAIRDSDPNLVHQPLWQLQSSDAQRVLKFGPRMFSFHALQVYPGWATFEPELLSAASYLFRMLGEFTVTRYGFRYVNVLTKKHFVSSLADLNFDVRLAGSVLTCPMNLNYERSHSTNHRAIVRVAPKEFVQNPSEGLEAVIDIDIFTPPEFKSEEQDGAGPWVAQAHIYLKEEFFTLLPESLIYSLEEK